MIFSKFTVATSFPRLRDKSEDWVLRIAQLADNVNTQLNDIIEGIYASISGSLSPKIIEPDSVTQALTNLEKKANYRGLNFITSALKHLFELLSSYIINIQEQSIDFITHIPTVESATTFNAFELTESLIILDIPNAPHMKF